MPSLYIVLDKKIPGAGTGVNGNSLSRNNKELEKMAKGLGVKTLMSFFSTSKEEVEALGGDVGSLGSKIEEKWFAAEEGLRTVTALLESLSTSTIKDVGRVEADLREFVGVLELAKANGIRWHLAVDY